MSKTIETLKKASFKEDVFRNHIADTYFSQKPAAKARKKKHPRSQAPLITLPAIKLPVINIEPILKAGIAVSLVFATLSAASIVITYINNKHMNFLKHKVASLSTITAYANGSVNREFIRSFEFRGHARNRLSRIARDGIVFTNPEKYKWADLSIVFRVPIDASSKNLHLKLKGDIGGERINVVLRDTHNRSYRISDIWLSSAWSDKTIPLNPIKDDIDISSIDHLRIESGYIGESVKENDPRVDFKIYVSEVSISKEPASPASM